MILPEIILITFSLLNLCLGWLVLQKNRHSSSNIAFFLLSILVVVWNFINYLADTFSSEILFSGGFAVGSLVISMGATWATLFTKQKHSTILVILYLMIGTLFFFLSFQPQFLVETISLTQKGVAFESRPSVGLFIYGFYYLSLSIIILYTLRTKSYLSGSKKSNYKNIVLLGAVVTLSTTAATSFALPFLFSAFFTSAIDSIGFFVFSMLVTYSILKHNLYNVKIIGLEIIIFILWLLLLLRIVLSNTTNEALLTGGFFLLILIFSTLLVKSVLRGIELRTHLEQLTSKFESTRINTDV